MEDWVKRALARWPNVPALFGWLGLDRRGRWRIRGELITRPQIIETFNANYAGDEFGRWFFQNGPQRGYVKLDHMPLLLRVNGAGTGLETHTGLAVTRVSRAYLDQQGALMLATEHGPGALDYNDLDWTVERLSVDGRPIDEESLANAMLQASDTPTNLALRLDGHDAPLPLHRLDTADAEAALGFVRDPQPRPGEKCSY